MPVTTSPCVTSSSIAIARFWCTASAARFSVFCLFLRAETSAVITYIQALHKPITLKKHGVVATLVACMIHGHCKKKVPRFIYYYSELRISERASEYACRLLKCACAEFSIGPLPPRLAPTFTCSCTTAATAQQPKKKKKLSQLLSNAKRDRRDAEASKMDVETPGGV